MEHGERDEITVRDERGNLKQFHVEALFDMDENSYALLSANNEAILMRIEQNGDEQELIGITNPEEVDAIMDAYEIAIEADIDKEDN